MKDNLIAGLLFAAFFGLYVHSAAPHVAPYRDAGEMVVLGNTLGVAHPPGYPLYTLLTNMWKNLPVGNAAYRMNVFSGVAAALAVALFFLLMRVWVGQLPALVAALAFGLSTVFWELAGVSEMYTLGAVMVLLLLLAMFRAHSPPLAAFLFALALGARMDLLLFVPLLVYWAWSEGQIGEWKGIGLGFLLGVSIFLYMMIRSRQNPLLDWGNPDNLGALFNSMTRKSYSGTLDLLSLSYKRGENFGVNTVLYGKHLWQSFSPIGIFLALVGLRKVPRFFIVAFAIAGPLFLFMANMPPNPHAVAIIEASYLLPDIFIAVFIGFGLQVLMQNLWLFRAAAALAVIGLFVQFPQAYARTSKRNNFYTEDYVTNLLRSAPQDSVVVMHKDVQIFSLWVAQAIDRKRLDVSFVPTGLAGSPWFWEMKKRWPAKSSPDVALNDADGWDQLGVLAAGRPYLCGYDVDTPGGGAPALPPVPHGLLISLRPINNDAHILPELCVTRGPYRYGHTPDFFSTDLIGDHAKAHHRHGLEAMNKGRLNEADWFFVRAGVLDPTFPRAFMDRGYLAYTQNRFDIARAFQARGVELYRRLVRQGDDFKALPDVRRALRADLSSAYLNLGASCEKMGDIEAARASYGAAAEVYPNAQAYYNMAVTYWGKDWPNVLKNLEACLKINPQFPEAAKFLAVARAKAGA